MAERPMLMSAPMVRAILDGKKTQTRRIVKPQPPAGHTWAGWCLYSTHKADEGKATWAVGSGPLLSDVRRVACPYGQPGDRLWVREHWATDIHYDGVPPRDLPPAYAVRYLADGGVRGGLGQADGKDRRAFHMPRWASRITLEITSVRVDRLQNISRGDAMAEGCPFPNMANATSPRDWYAALWEQINGGGSWDADPWVWVVEFKRIK